jgi:hypothetical protein
MYFRTFTLGANTEKLIEKAGFRVNSFQEVKSYCGIHAESITKTPKDYLYDGGLWEQFDVSDFSERLVLLCKMPIPPFNELWNLYLTGNKEDSFGSLSIIAKKYANEMITELQSMISTQNSSKVFRKKLLELKTSPIIANSSQSKQIISVINGALVDG